MTDNPLTGKEILEAAAKSGEVLYIDFSGQGVGEPFRLQKIGGTYNLIPLPDPIPDIPSTSD